MLKMGNKVVGSKRQSQKWSKRHTRSFPPHKPTPTISPRAAPRYHHPPSHTPKGLESSPTTPSRPCASTVKPCARGKIPTDRLLSSDESAKSPCPRSVLRRTNSVTIRLSVRRNGREDGQVRKGKERPARLVVGSTPRANDRASARLSSNLKGSHQN